MKRQRKHHKQCRQPVDAIHPPEDVDGKRKYVLLRCMHTRSVSPSYPVGNTMHCPECWLRRELDVPCTAVVQHRDV